MITSMHLRAVSATAFLSSALLLSPLQDATPVARPVQAATTATGSGVVLPLEKSGIVHRNKFGSLVVAAVNNRPIDGIKLSRHDSEINNPSIVVTPDGTIHVAFVEKMAQYPYTYSVYHRASRDGGRTWSEAKNLSEVMPDYQIGNCSIAADGEGRVYVIWRTSIAPNYPVSETIPHSTQVSNNLVYRVLDGGAWSGKAILVHPPATKEDQNCGSASWFASTDPNGKVHVLWNTLPDKFHPESLSDKSHSPAVGTGLILGVTLEGKSASRPEEVFLAPIRPDKEVARWPHCDTLDVLDGYVDADGQAHILSYVHSLGISTEPTNRFELIENKKATVVVELPGTASEYWQFPPTLLVDAQGRKHVLTMYTRGEQPNVRDYIVGSDDEPTVIRAAKQVSGKLMGFQAFQGPEGKMVVIMEMNDTGKDTDDELYLSTSSGGKWSAPVNVTNNTGRLAFHSTQTSSHSHVATESYWYPGPAAATYDKSGHLVLTYVSKQFSIVDSSAFGVSIAGGSTSTPKLLFLRF